MTPLARRLFFAGWTAVALVIGILLANFFRTARPTPRIRISGDAVASPDEETIHCSSFDVVNWVGASGDTIAIVFKKDDFDPRSTTNPLKEPPFDGGTPGVDQKIHCAGASCASLNINPALVKLLSAHHDDEFTYKYWQYRNGKSKDGKIIIRW